MTSFDWYLLGLVEVVSAVPMTLGRFDVGVLAEVEPFRIPVADGGSLVFGCR